ncbi:MAG: glycine cleavage system protein GcvH [Alphaproteobacteria bacterium]|nr:glycine cleavage system protein GcvH [Alphaproteobacteria bacterium]
MTTYFTDQHEWIKVEGGIATVGITAHAAEQLGDVVFVELPAIGKALTKSGEAAVVESVKAASDVYAPVSGEVTEANDTIVGEPAKVNEDPEGAGWFFKLKLTNESELSGLMDKAAYDAFVASGG